MEACEDCTYLFDSTERVIKVVGLKPTCLAFFPNPIPSDILNGEVGHSTPHPSQHNEIVYRQQSHFTKK